MNNKVILENPTRRGLKAASVLLALYFVLFTGVVIFISSGNKQNFNGEVKEIGGIVESVSANDSTVMLKLQDDDRKITTSCVENLYDWQMLQGKSVTFVVPKEQKVVEPYILLGMTVDGEKVIDEQQTLISAREDGRFDTNMLFAISAIFGVATCAVVVVRINTKHTKEFVLGEQYCKFYCQKQPLYPKRKALTWIALTWILLVIGTTVGIGIVNSQETVNQPLNIAFICAFVAVNVICLAVILIVAKWLTKQDIIFYAEKFPFDFTDISHIPMKKKVKESLQKEILQSVQDHPNEYGDGGNGFLVKFTADGAQLFIDDFYEEQLDVFAEEKKPMLQLSYEQLNFEAVPYYKIAQRPLFVVVKSRLTDETNLIEGFVNDLHFILDSNLLKTLQTFAVPVENLQEILQNKQQLMTEHCKKRK